MLHCIVLPELADPEFPRAMKALLSGSIGFRLRVSFVGS